MKLTQEEAKEKASLKELMEADAEGAFRDAETDEVSDRSLTEEYDIL